MTYHLSRRFASVIVSVVLVLALSQLLQLNGGLSAQAKAGNPSVQLSPLCSPCYSFYGSNHSWMYYATNDWYQHQGNWCGIANIRAIQVYDWLYYNGRAPAWDNSQEAIHNRLNSYSSPWGSGGGYVWSNISRDFGTDPHAIAYGAWYDTPVGTSTQPYWFHNWIYRTSSKTATYDFGTDFGRNTVSHNDPISVTIDGAYHSFVVDGVWATSDPSYPGTTLSAIDTWDPWLNHANHSVDGTHPYNQTQNQVWSLTDWTTNPIRIRPTATTCRRSTVMGSPTTGTRTSLPSSRIVSTTPIPRLTTLSIRMGISHRITEALLGLAMSAKAIRCEKYIDKERI
ncbi:MAG: hypothetical protein E6J22_18665 [Chloroflexi bacterium]|nr:MAG: hypothetical protein E6J22_18665 [Chloroflexota bacterium]